MPIIKDCIYKNEIIPYKVTSDGYIYSKRNTSKKLRFNLNHKGYPLVKLYIHGEKHTVAVHRLIAETFIPNPDNKPTVNHIDGNKLNNSVDNLEWATHSEQAIHAFNAGLRVAKIGKYHARSKFDELLIRQICELYYNKNMTIKQIKKKLKIENRDIVRDVVKRKRWKYISDEYIKASSTTIENEKPRIDIIITFS